MHFSVVVTMCRAELPLHLFQSNIASQTPGCTAVQNCPSTFHAAEVCEVLLEAINFDCDHVCVAIFLEHFVGCSFRAVSDQVSKLPATKAFGLGQIPIFP